MASVQDRTVEFRSILQQAQKKANAQRPAAQRQALLSDTQKQNGAGSAAAERRQRSEFAREAAKIGRGISGTVAKLERLAQLAKRKTLFDDRPVEIAELTYVIKQDLSALNSQIGRLQQISKAGGPQKASDQEGEHNKNVVVLLQKNLADVSVNFKDVLEVRTKNIQASRSRTENFVSSVSSHAQSSALDPHRNDSPLYQTPTRSRSPKPGYTGGQDILSLDPNPSSSSNALRGAQSDQQMLMMEEAQPQNSYISQRGEAIEAIERTIGELGGIFGQLATMVSEQSEMIQRIDANTEDVVDNVQGAQRELLKYWGRVSSNRWLIAKMFGVLMICESLFWISSHVRPLIQAHSLFDLGPDFWMRFGTVITHEHGTAFMDHESFVLPADDGTDEGPAVKVAVIERCDRRNMYKYTNTTTLNELSFADHVRAAFIAHPHLVDPVRGNVDSCSWTVGSLGGMLIARI